MSVHGKPPVVTICDSSGWISIALEVAIINPDDGDVTDDVTGEDRNETPLQKARHVLCTFASQSPVIASS